MQCQRRSLLIILCIALIIDLEECLQHQCVLTPESNEGNFFLLPNLIRSDIREHRPGIRFELELLFTDAVTCDPLSDLWVTLWQSDALGYYSGYTGINPLLELNPGHVSPTDNSTFLRGAQQTDPQGRVRFVTVQPGYHGNRARHIHIRAYYTDKSVFTGQLYFEEGLSSAVHRVFPYYIQNHRFNAYDPVFNKYNGNETIIYDIQQINDNRITDGFRGRMVIGLDLNSKVIDERLVT